VDVSERECVAAMLEQNFVYYPYAGQQASRLGQCLIGPWFIADCADGKIFVFTVEEDQWKRLAEFMGNPEWANDELFSDRLSRERNNDALKALMADWLGEWKVLDLHKEAQRRRIPFATINTMQQLYESEQRFASRVIARGWLGSENSSPSLPNATSNLCFPTSIAAFTPPISLILTAAGAATPPCTLIRARLCVAAPSTVRVLLRVFGRVASCCPTASLGPGRFELTHLVLFFSADSEGNIQGRLVVVAPLRSSFKIVAQPATPQYFQLHIGILVNRRYARNPYFIDLLERSAAQLILGWILRLALGSPPICPPNDMPSTRCYRPVTTLIA
jgi:hypothetical protein